MDHVESDKISFYNVPNDTFLQQQLCHHNSVKSLPSLETKDSLEDIKLIKQLDKYSENSKKNILHSFVRKTTFENRPSRRLQQKSKGNQDLHKKSNPELNFNKMPHKMTKENGFKHFDIHKFGRKIINHFKKETEPGPSQIKKKNEKQNRRGSNILKCDSNNKETETNITHSLKKMNINEIKSTSQCKFNIPKKSEILLKSDNSLNANQYANNSIRPDLMENSNEIQHLFTQKQLDFSSGDVKNLNSQSDDACSSKNYTENQSHILSKRKSVQWNREVDVVYYAGDINGGEFNLYVIYSNNQEMDF